MMKQDDPKVYRSSHDIFRLHGPLVLALYWISWGLSWISLGYIARNLPHYSRRLKSAIDKDTGKVLAWWQDLASTLPITMTIFVTIAASQTTLPAPKFFSYAAIYIIFDAAIYEMRVLWFDDITPGISDSRRDVWSHRRIMFYAIIAYAQSIILFPAIYWRAPSLKYTCFHNLLERSFKAATFTSIADPLTKFDVAQVAVSLFFIAIVIATTASVAYQRNEVAGKLMKE